jgi:hypothetical protein
MARTGVVLAASDHRAIQERVDRVKPRGRKEYLKAAARAGVAVFEAAEHLYESHWQPSQFESGQEAHPVPILCRICPQCVGRGRGTAHFAASAQ